MKYIKDGWNWLFPGTVPITSNNHDLPRLIDQVRSDGFLVVKKGREVLKFSQRAVQDFCVGVVTHYLYDYITLAENDLQGSGSMVGKINTIGRDEEKEFLQQNQKARLMLGLAVLSASVAFLAVGKLGERLRKRWYKEEVLAEKIATEIGGLTMSDLQHHISQFNESDSKREWAQSLHLSKVAKNNVFLWESSYALGGAIQLSIIDSRNSFSAPLLALTKNLAKIILREIYKHGNRCKTGRLFDDNFLSQFSEQEMADLCDKVILPLMKKEARLDNSFKSFAVDTASSAAFLSVVRDIHTSSALKNGGKWALAELLSSIINIANKGLRKSDEHKSGEIEIVEVKEESRVEEKESEEVIEVKKESKVNEEREIEEEMFLGKDKDHEIEGEDDKKDEVRFNIIPHPIITDQQGQVVGGDSKDDEKGRKK